MLNTTFEAAEPTSVCVEDALPALVEFTAALVIAMSGKEGMNAVVARLQRRADHWRNGNIRRPRERKSCATSVPTDF